MSRPVNFAVHAQVLAAGAAIRALAVGPAEPRHADPPPVLGGGDDLVAEDQRQVARLDLAVAQVQVGAADAAGVHAQEQLSGSGLGRVRPRPPAAACPARRAASRASGRPVERREVHELVRRDGLRLGAARDRARLVVPPRHGRPQARAARPDRHDAVARRPRPRARRPRAVRARGARARRPPAPPRGRRRARAGARARSRRARAPRRSPARRRRARARTRGRAGTPGTSRRSGGRRCGRSPTSGPAGSRAARARAAGRGGRSRDRACRACRRGRAAPPSARRAPAPSGRGRAPRRDRAAHGARSTRRRGSCRRGSTTAAPAPTAASCAGSGGPSRSASSARASSARAMPSSRSLLVTALRPVHGPGCSSSRKRRAVGADAGEILAEALAEDGAGGGGHVKSVSTPASTKAPAHTPSRLIHALRSTATPKRSYTSSATHAHHRDHRGDVQQQPDRAGQQRRAAPAGGLDRVVVGGRAGRAGADQHRRDHQPGAVGAGHQERPPRQLAPVDAHRRPARVRARPHEAEDAEQRSARSRRPGAAPTCRSPARARAPPRRRSRATARGRRRSPATRG